MTIKNKDKMKKKDMIEEFYKDFDEDMDRLYQEEFSLLNEGKYKKRLKYPESFYVHWKKKLMELMMKIEARGYKDGYKAGKKEKSK